MLQSSMINCMLNRYMRPSVSMRYTSSLSKTQQMKSMQPSVEFLTYLDKIQIGHIRDPIKRKSGQVSGKLPSESLNNIGYTDRPSKSELKRNFKEKYRSGKSDCTTGSSVSNIDTSSSATATATAAKMSKLRTSTPKGTNKHLPKPYPFDIPSRKIARFLKADYPGQIFPNSVIPEVVAIGRSNAGKSTLINALLGFKAHVQQSPVTAKPGETRSLHFYGLPFSAKEQTLALPKGIEDKTTASATDMSKPSEEVNIAAAVKAPPYSLIVVDMPGFGFSYMNEKELYRCRQLCFEYLCTRGDILKTVMMCVDARHGMKLADKQFFKQLLEHRLESWQRGHVDHGSPESKRIFPWKLNIILTKCDLIDRVELGKRMLFVKQEIQEMLLELKRDHELDGAGTAYRSDLSIMGFIDDIDTFESVQGQIFPVSALGQSSLGHRSGVIGGTQCKGLLALQTHLSGIVDACLPFTPYEPAIAVGDVDVFEECDGGGAIISKPTVNALDVENYPTLPSEPGSVSGCSGGVANNSYDFIEKRVTIGENVNTSGEKRIKMNSNAPLKKSNVSTSGEKRIKMNSNAPLKKSNDTVGEKENVAKAKTIAKSTASIIGGGDAVVQSTTQEQVLIGNRKQRRAHLFVPSSDSASKSKSKIKSKNESKRSSNTKVATNVTVTTIKNQFNTKLKSKSNSFSKMKAYRAAKKEMSTD